MSSFASNRPTGPRTQAGHALAVRMRRVDPEVDWDAWIRDIEAQATSVDTLRVRLIDEFRDWPGGAERVSKDPVGEPSYMRDPDGGWIVVYVGRAEFTRYAETEPSPATRHRQQPAPGSAVRTD